METLQEQLEEIKEQITEQPEQVSAEFVSVSPNYKGKHPLSKEELAKRKGEKKKLYESKDKMVSHPAHYQSDGIEVIDVIKAFTKDLKGIQATDSGNIIKYACRWNAKGNPIQDVEKIIWYATHLLRELQAEEQDKKESK